MSTRANIIVKDRFDHLIFYRHSDGYPEGVKETLDKFCNWMKSGAIRNNIVQGCGWLIILGAEEYKSLNAGIDPATDQPVSWKVGAYEPTADIHGDISHAYLIDMEKMEWKEIPVSRAKQIAKSKVTKI